MIDYSDHTSDTSEAMAAERAMVSRAVGFHARREAKRARQLARREECRAVLVWLWRIHLTRKEQR